MKNILLLAFALVLSSCAYKNKKEDLQKYKNQ